MDRRPLRLTRGKPVNKNARSFMINHKWIIVLFVLLSLSVVGYKGWEVATHVISADTSCSVCGSPLSLLRDREDLDSTVYVLESPLDRRLIGAWVVISNHNLGQSLVVYIPPGVYIADPNELFNAYVQYTDLEYAGSLLNEKRSKEYALWQTENLIGFSIERYVWVTKEAVNSYALLYGDVSEYSPESFRGIYEKNSSNSDASLMINSFVDRFNLLSILMTPSLWSGYIGSVDTSFTSVEYLLEATAVKNRFNAKGVRIIDLSQERFLNIATDSSGRQINVINYSEFDKEIERSFNLLRSREVEKEQAKVEVYNGSGIPGLASRYARKVKNYGVRVVRYDNSPSEVEKTHIYVAHPDRFPNSFKSVQEIVCENCEVIEGRPDFITTGDIIVILGKDKEKELKWR